MRKSNHGSSMNPKEDIAEISQPLPNLQHCSKFPSFSLFLCSFLFQLSLLEIKLKPCRRAKIWGTSSWSFCSFTESLRSRVERLEVLENWTHRRHIRDTSGPFFIRVHPSLLSTSTIKYHFAMKKDATLTASDRCFMCPCV